MNSKKFHEINSLISSFINNEECALTEDKLMDIIDEAYNDDKIDAQQYTYLTNQFL